MEAAVHAASGNNVKHAVFVAGSQDECGKINSDSILYGIFESVQQFIANKATVKLWIVTRGSLNISVDGGEAVCSVVNCAVGTWKTDCDRVPSGSIHDG